MAVTSADAPRPTQRPLTARSPPEGHVSGLGESRDDFTHYQVQRNLAELWIPDRMPLDMRFNLTRNTDLPRFPGRVLNQPSSRRPTTRLHVSGHRFLARRLECALLRRDVGAVNEPLRAHSASLALGALLAGIALAGCALVGLLRPQVALDRALIVMGRDSGALFVRVGDTWHPVLNLASARLIAATDANPLPVPESELGRTKRGPLLGISGAPQLLGQPLTGDEAAWTICDTDDNPATTIVVGRTDESSFHQLAPERALLVAPGPGLPSYLLYDGRRAVVDPADAAVVRALRLETGPRRRLAGFAEYHPGSAGDHRPTYPRRGGRGESGSPASRSAVCCASPAATVTSITSC